MKLKRCISAALSAVIIAGAFPSVDIFTGSAGGTQASEFTIATSAGITYHKYSDHVELSNAAVSGDISVPSQIAGIPVTIIGDNAFAGREVTSVSLPESVAEIGKYAFKDCRKLEKIVINNKNCTVFDSGDTICNSAGSGSTAAVYSGKIVGYDNSPAAVYAAGYKYRFESLSASSAVTTSTASKTTTTTTTSKTTSSTSKPTTTTSKTTTTTSTTTTSTTTTTTRTAVQGKPVFKLSHTEVCKSMAPNRKEQLTITVEGAENLYSETVLYVYFDSRLKIGEATAGQAISQLTWGQALGDTKDFIVLTTGGAADTGKDGLMWTVDVTLPADCKVGDIFTYEIGKSKYGKIQPLFTNFANDDKGKAMTKYAFSEGLDKGEIKIIEDPPYEMGDINNDKLVDSVDASMLLKEYATVSIGKTSTFKDARQAIAADVNNDGKADAVDASAILAFYAFNSSSDKKADFAEFMKTRNKAQ
ncbi:MULTISPECIES: leucine-rich repeat protein [Ruminococcus]|uniref:Leucine rich repeat-containing protein n=1 Tax=Ruminococcus flavefaciens TaxID=1265 RepID=A0A1M7IL19_RUMFL|nr:MULTISPECIES: leucine-rich repeat protein [Ruminococcus]MCR4795006.1 leucine-rich repeat protein [Ruminococcus sp.]SHM41308.1 Leucine rich repeat-containing protein [Ruminococcus flavefaciens]